MSSFQLYLDIFITVYAFVIESILPFFLVNSIFVYYRYENANIGPWYVEI